MPSRNVLKIDIPQSYYHVYARGTSRSEIFLDPEVFQGWDKDKGLTPKKAQVVYNIPMPVRNVVRYQSPDTFYHVYNRGHNRDLLFADEDDYRFFLWLLERCYGPIQLKNKDGKLFPWFGDQIAIHAFCLMPNHFHLLLHQGEDISSLSKSMQSLATTYSMYFNKKYERRGSIFESVFKSSPVLNESYLQHITRYIHLNPKDFKAWPYSSYNDYLGGGSDGWVVTEKILSMFDSRAQYKQFIDDYLDLRNELEKLKYELADHCSTYYDM